MISPVLAASKRVSYCTLTINNQQAGNTILPHIIVGTDAQTQCMANRILPSAVTSNIEVVRK